MKIYWEGYIQDDYGLSLIQVYDDAAGPYVYIRGNLADDIIEKDDLFKEAGQGRFYKTIEDFKVDDWLTVEEVWPKELENG